MSRCSEISRELYGHVHLLCQYIQKILHVVGRTSDDVLLPEEQWIPCCDSILWQEAVPTAPEIAVAMLLECGAPVQI